MANSRSQFVANFFNCSTRAISRQANVFFNQASDQLQDNNSRIKKLNDEEQSLERRNRAVSANSDQVIDNSRISQEDNADDDDELDNID